MSSELRTLGRHAMIYGLGNAIAKLASFVMLPIYTRYLTPADYGVLELLSMTIDLIGILTGAGVWASVYPFFAEHKPHGTENRVMSTAAIGMIALAVVTAVVGLFASPALSTLATSSAGKPIYFRLFFIIFVAQSAELVPFLMCRALQRSVMVVVINLARLLGLITLNVVFVVHFHFGVMGILLSNVIVSLVIASGMLVFLFKKTGLVFMPSLFVEMVRYGFPMVFGALGNFFLVFSDRYFLNHYAGAAVVGLYALAYKFGFILSAFVFNPFFQIWGPQRFLIATQANARDIYRRVFLYINIALGFVGLGIAIFIRDLLKIMADQAFWSAYAVVPLVVLVQIIHHWSDLNNLGLFLAKKTKKITWGSFVAIPSVLLFNVLLIPRWGVWGAIAATLIAYVLRFAVVQVLSQREYLIDYGWSRITGLYALLIAAYALRVPFGDLHIVQSILLGSGLLLLAGTGIYFLILSHDERAGMKMLLARRLTFKFREEPRVAVPEPAADLTVHV